MLPLDTNFVLWILHLLDWHVSERNSWFVLICCMCFKRDPKLLTINNSAIGLMCGCVYDWQWIINTELNILKLQSLIEWISFRRSVNVIHQGSHPLHDFHERNLPWENGKYSSRPYMTDVTFWSGQCLSSPIIMTPSVPDFPAKIASLLFCCWSRMHDFSRTFAWKYV